jgi:D-serine deaminase-like pyridoxal phosphate-dependent protein
MAAAGIRNIFIANQITHPLKLKRLRDLHEKTKLAVGTDHPRQIRLLNEYFSDLQSALDVLIEIDSGLQRCGLLPGPRLIDLARQIKESEYLNFKGIFTHAGQVYSAGSTEEIRRIAGQEAQIMLQSRQLLQENGIGCEIISVGSTPSAPYLVDQEGVTEIRPGNYVFYDNIQYKLGSCRTEQWAMFVLATVISQPAAQRIIIDAGSKALNLDRGAHATNLTEGYGRILNLRGEIVRLSEEHGVIQLDNAEEIIPGSAVLIVPNHACAVTNLYAKFYLLNQDGSFEIIPVDARGMSQ